MEKKQNQTTFHGTYLNLTACLFYQNILKYFNDFQNWVFPVLWLKWTQTMEMKQNQTFFHGTYSNLAPFLSKHILVFKWLSKSKFLDFLTKVNLNNGNDTKSDIFPRDVFKSDIIFIGHKMLKYLNGFYNWHFSISLQEWSQSCQVK